MIDFHSHILPGIDDGSSCINESLEMLTVSKQQGINFMVASPHFYAAENTPASFLAKRNEAYKKLSDCIGSTNLPKIIPGAEVGYFEGMSDCEELKKLRIAGTSLIMIEMPVCKWSDRMLNELVSVYEKQELIPLIAHIDRYIKLLNDKKAIHKLSGLPVLIQANSSFFINKKTTRHAISLLEKGKIHLLGSDCHNNTSRPQNLADAHKIIEAKLGKEALRRINFNEKLVFSQKNRALEELFI